MPEARFASEAGMEFLFIDLTRISDYHLVQPVVGEATQLARSVPGPDSLMTLLDLSGTRVNKLVISSLKSLSQKNGRYAKATAFVGLNWFWSFVLTTMFRMRGKKNHKVFSNRQEAIQWLQAR